MSDVLGDNSRALISAVSTGLLHDARLPSHENFPEIPLFHGNVRVAPPNTFILIFDDIQKSMNFYEESTKLSICDLEYWSFYV